MKLFTRDFKRNSTWWTGIAFYFICGLLLLLLPDLALSIANFALAAILCAIGVKCIVTYLRGSVLDAVLGIDLAMGLVLTCVGVILLFNPLFLGSLLPFLWGLALLVGGFGKVQLSVDLKRIGTARWWLTLIGAAFSFVLGILAITQPAFIAAVFVQFVGVALIVEAVLDLAAYLTINKRIKDFRKALEKKTVEV